MCRSTAIPLIASDADGNPISGVTASLELMRGVAGFLEFLTYELIGNVCI